jgi:hypothetical protein
MDDDGLYLARRAVGKQDLGVDRRTGHLGLHVQP